MMNVQPDVSGRKTLTWHDILLLVKFAGTQRHAFPAMIILGLLSSFSESLGISFVVLYVYDVMGRTSEVINGDLGGIFAQSAQALSGIPLGPSVLFLLIGKAFFNAAYAVFSVAAQNNIGELFRRRIHGQFLQVEFSFIRQKPEGELFNILATESWSLSEAFRSAALAIVSLIGICVTGAFIIVISWQLALIVAVGAFLLVAGVQLIAKPARRLGARMISANEEMAAQSFSTLENMRVVRAFGQEEEYQRKFEAVADNAQKLTFQTNLLQTLVSPISEMGYLLILAVLTAAATLLHIPFAKTLACVGLLLRLQTPVRDLQNSVVTLFRLESPLAAIARLLDPSDKRFVKQGHLPFEGLRRDIAFDNVTFRYTSDGKDILRGVTFKIPAGVTTAIVGDSGAGKTTLINMIIRLDIPTSGEIRVDGVPLENIRRTDWLHGLALSGQDADLMDSTIRENIRVARHNATDDELFAAATTAGIADFISSHPDGLDRWIGPAAKNISGGQRQRIGLARAFLRRPKFLILDEATNALDYKLEDEVRKMVGHQFAGGTIIWVTHRLENALDADHIVCLEDGCVMETGSPSELLRKNGAFSAMLSRARSRRIESFD